MASADLAAASSSPASSCISASSYSIASASASDGATSSGGSKRLASIAFDPNLISTAFTAITPDAEVLRRAVESSTLDREERLAKHMKVKVIIKENHGSVIKTLCFAPGQAEADVVLTVGGSQANLYDNRHCGAFLDLYVHFANTRPLRRRGSPSSASTMSGTQSGVAAATGGPAAGGDEPLDLLCGCFVPFDCSYDALVALGGANGVIQVLSVSQRRVVTLLRGHTGPVSALCAHPTRSWVLSASRVDRTIRLWDCSRPGDLDEAGACLARFSCEASALLWSADGSSFFSGSPTGKVCEWKLPAVLVQSPDRGAPVVSGPLVVADPGRELSKLVMAAFVESMGLLPAVDGRRRLLIKMADGLLVMADAEDGRMIRHTQLGRGDPARPSQLGLTRDAAFAAVGDADGNVHVVKLTSLTVLTTLSHRRSKQPIDGCAFSADSDNIVVSSGDLLWRWDFLPLGGSASADEMQP